MQAAPYSIEIVEDPSRQRQTHSDSLSPTQFGFASKAADAIPDDGDVSNVGCKCKMARSRKGEALKAAGPYGGRATPSFNGIPPRRAALRPRPIDSCILQSSELIERPSSTRLITKPIINSLVLKRTNHIAIAVSSNRRHGGKGVGDPARLTAQNA